ncbi:MAG: sulfurtransferase-like selenium metabolism protein YedF [Gudongella sp.]|jgi:selenium metabolism protein YedF|nr:sulfurtransferase-like selenium metabolism protein YedF [Gudongella sp.]
MRKEIDAKGLACPKPVILTKKELDQLESGEVRTIVDNDVAVQNLSRLAESLNMEYDKETLGDSIFAVTIKKGDVQAEEPVKEKAVLKGTGNIVAIQSDEMGKGDSALGKILMKSFIYTVKETSPHPAALIFYNSGVKLTVDDSPVLDDLKALEEAGVEIISCGTCLDFYELKEKLAVGIISNMYTIYEKISGADNTITIG